MKARYVDDLKATEIDGVNGAQVNMVLLSDVNLSIRLFTYTHT
jgi:hypothetical protein